MSHGSSSCCNNLGFHRALGRGLLRYIAKFCSVVLLSSAVVSPLAAATGAEGTARPNILLIYTDDQTFRTLGCYRDAGAWPWVETPSIDRLAAEGVRFETCYGAAWCTPSRASLLTGRYQHAIQGLRGTAVLEAEYDPKVCRFWPAELRRSGYTTAMIGKWHVSRDAGHGRDWDHSVVWNQADIVGDWYNDQPLSIDGREKQVVPGYSTDVYTQHAVDFVQRKHSAPWYLWLCYNAPHLPNTVAPRHRSKYADAEVPIPSDMFGPRADVPTWQRAFTQWKPGPDGGPPLYGKSSLPENVRAYNRLVSAVDEGVGRLLKTLAETKQLDDTLILFTSDQGFAWGEHGFAWKVGPYDACLRMPLLVRWPKVAVPGGVCKHPVTIVDVAATVTAAAEATIPWKLQGHDLRPLLERPDAAWNFPAFMEHTRWEFGDDADGTHGRPEMRGVPWWTFVRRGRYKYVRTLVENEIEELYDLERDPHERVNLAVQAEHQSRLVEYRDLLRDELRRTEASWSDTLPPPRAAN